MSRNTARANELQPHAAMVIFTFRFCDEINRLSTTTQFMLHFFAIEKHEQREEERRERGRERDDDDTHTCAIIIFTAKHNKSVMKEWTCGCPAP